jgi:hypothetical protein
MKDNELYNVGNNAKIYLHRRFFENPPYHQFLELRSLTKKHRNNPNNMKFLRQQYMMVSNLQKK